MDLMRDRNEYLAQIRSGEPWNKSKLEMQMDATDPQPATSEMLCGFVLGCVFSAVVLWIWGIKF